MDEIIEKQSGIISKMNAFKVNFNKHDKNNRTKGYWISRRDQLTAHWNEFEENHVQAGGLYDEKIHKTYKYFSADYFSIADESVHDMLGEIGDLIEQIEAGKVVVRAEPKLKSAEFKLPRLELPMFGGEYEEWNSFYDLYVAAVHSKTDVPKVQKLQFLK